MFETDAYARYNKTDFTQEGKALLQNRSHPQAITQFRHQQPRILSVSEINAQVKHCLDVNFDISYIRGEVANLSKPSSGHYYFTLKDAHAQIQCTLFKAQALQIPGIDYLKNGVGIVIKSKISLYPNRGTYQTVVSAFRLEGEGLLKQQLLALRKKLAQEGLFATERKRNIPDFPRRIAVITSPVAAGLQDFIKTLSLRYPLATLIIYPAMVQGLEAGSSLCLALKKVMDQKTYEHDVVVFCRGGGSLEDLWCFNDESLVRLIADCTIPCISAIGHETDHTLCDDVADRRATTPTDAANIISPDKRYCLQSVSVYQDKLNSHLHKHCQRMHQHVQIIKERLKASHPLNQLKAATSRLDHLKQRLAHTIKIHLSSQGNQWMTLRRHLQSPVHLHSILNPMIGRQQRLEQACWQAYEQILLNKIQTHQKLNQRLSDLYPLAILDRGFAYVTQNGHHIQSLSALQEDWIDVHFKDGIVRARIQLNEPKTEKEG